MNKISVLFGVISLAMSSAAFSLNPTPTPSTSPCCEVLGFANNNGYVSATTAVAAGGNKASGGNVAGSSLSIATADPAVFGSVTVTATSGGVAALADQVLSSNNGGLGVTSVVKGVASISPVTSGDVITLTFANPVQLTAIEFDDKNFSQTCTLGVLCNYNPGGDLLTSATKFGLSVNGGAVQTYSLGGYAPGQTTDNVLWLTTLNVVGTTFSFSTNSASGSTPFYIGAIAYCSPTVPEPSTYAILGLGLAGFAWLKRARSRV